MCGTIARASWTARCCRPWQAGLARRCYWEWIPWIRRPVWAWAPGERTGIVEANPPTVAERAIDVIDLAIRVGEERDRREPLRPWPYRIQRVTLPGQPARIIESAAPVAGQVLDLSA